MFEGWLSGLLTSALSEYIQEHCFTPDRVHTSVLYGHVVLEELELKRSAFDFLHPLPIVLVRGCIGQVNFWLANYIYMQIK